MLPRSVLRPARYTVQDWSCWLAATDESGSSPVQPGDACNRSHDCAFTTASDCQEASSFASLGCSWRSVGWSTMSRFEPRRQNCTRCLVFPCSPDLHQETDGPTVEYSGLPTLATRPRPARRARPVAKLCPQPNSGFAAVAKTRICGRCGHVRCLRPFCVGFPDAAKPLPDGHVRRSGPRGAETVPVRITRMQRACPAAFAAPPCCSATPMRFLRWYADLHVVVRQVACMAKHAFAYSNETSSPLARITAPARAPLARPVLRAVNAATCLPNRFPISRARPASPIRCR